MRKILLSWSGGKDSAWALHLLRQAGVFEVGGLLTTVNERVRRVAIHGFREELLDRQAERTGLPLWKIPLPFPCSNAEYEERMGWLVLGRLRRDSKGLRLGICFWRRYELIGWRSWRGRDWSRYFRFGGFRRIDWRGR